MSTTAGRHRPTVVVIGAGAAGSLVALHLVRAAGRRSTPLDLTVVDPADRWGRGVAFGTTDEEHLLNVPASGMSALPEDPGHFLSWLARHEPDRPTGPHVFLPRRVFARYLDDTLTRAVDAASGLVRVRHVRRDAVGVRPTPRGASVAIGDGGEVAADAVVVATGPPPAGIRWAPESLAHSAFFVADPWQPGALDVVLRDRQGPGDVLVVGTGLTMVDVALTLSRSDRPDRVLHAVSRNARLPHRHLGEPRLAVIPDVSGWATDLAAIRGEVRRHIEGVRAVSGDWRPAVDGLRFQLSTLWAGLSEDDRREFLARDAGAWNVLRHRVPPSSAVRIRRLRAARRLRVDAAEVLAAEPLGRGGVAVTLSDGTRREVGWVVNCTGPLTDVRDLGNPLVDDLLRPRAGAALATVATAGMGLRTVDGRLQDTTGATPAPIWTLGALRRGELWESTAVPEIRSQASALALSVLDAVAPLPRRLADGRLVSGHHPAARPRDPLGLPISTSSEAAAAYNAALERLMRLQAGVDDLLREAVVADPGFALGHAALAMLGHEAGATTDVRASLTAAREAVRRRGDDRERSFVDTVARRVQDVRGGGARALMGHIADFPRDVLAVSAAVPTIAFSGVTDVRREAWDLVEGLAAAYGDHWWFISLLAFTRQDQGRYDEAGLLAESALACEPSSGHGVHALTHVMYETGRHEAGRVWLDQWVAAGGRSASHRAHFSWHAALHELAVGDTEAVRRRYYSQLAPPGVTGVRALVDSGSLLWRWRVTTTDWDRAAGTGLGAPAAFTQEPPPPPVRSVLAAVDPGLVLRPETPFVALHSALALAADGDLQRLAGLRGHCEASPDAGLRAVVGPLCGALTAVVEERWGEATRTLTDVLPVLDRVGGSAAQREVVDETLLFCLVSDGRAREARALLEERLDRRPSPLDQRRLAAMSPAVGAGPTGADGAVGRDRAEAQVLSGPSTGEAVG